MQHISNAQSITLYYTCHFL